jgi:hypothetical protein
MRTVTLELGGSPLVDSLSLVANGLREREEVRVDEAWLAHHGCRVRPYDRFREALERELDAARASRTAVREGRELRVLLAVHGKPLVLVDLHLAEQWVCFSRVAPRELAP